MPNEIYFSIDIESDGPIPGSYSMLSLGAAAFKPGATGHVSSFSANLDFLPGASQNPSTMDWWKTQPEAWAACREDVKHPGHVMHNFRDWVISVCKEHGNAKAVCVAYPAGFDFTFVYWYLMEFVKLSPFSFSCIDIKTYAMALLGKGYRQATKKHMPKEWFSDLPHTHLAVDDAIEQGQLFMNIMAARDQLLTGETK